MPLAFRRLAAVQMGLSLQEILERLGPPDRLDEGGTQRLSYRLEDGSRAEILYAHPRLIKIVHYRQNGTRLRWIPAEARGA